MISRPCLRTTSSLPGVWTSSALWHRNGRSTYLKTHRVNPHLNRTDAPPAHPNPLSTRHPSLARTLLSQALVQLTPLTRVQATQPNTSLPSRLLPHLLTHTIRTPTQAQATTAISSLRWTRCQCNNKPTGCRSLSKACRTPTWPTCSSRPPCRPLTRSATWTTPQSSSGNSNITACIRLLCNNTWRTNFNRGASSRRL